jgi:two-component system, response regulator
LKSRPSASDLTALHRLGDAAISSPTEIGRRVVEILVVEDNPDEAGLMLYALRENNVGENVYVARDGQEAIDFLFSTGAYADRKNLPRPKLVLLDIKLPLVSGLEVLRQMKANDATRAVPIIVMTASRMESDVDECYDLGVNSYVVKPLDFDEFSETVRTIGYYWLRLNQLPESLAS